MVVNTEIICGDGDARASTRYVERHDSRIYVGETREIKNAFAKWEQRDLLESIQHVASMTREEENLDIIITRHDLREDEKIEMVERRKDVGD